MIFMRQGDQLAIYNRSYEVHGGICWGKYSLAQHHFVIHAAVTGAVWSIGLPVLVNNGRANYR